MTGAQPPIFVQGPREQGHLPTGEVEIPPPSLQPVRPTTSLSSLLLPAGITVGGIILMIAVLASQSAGQYIFLSMGISIPMILGSYLVSFINYRRQRKEYETAYAERQHSYNYALEEIRRRLTILRGQTQDSARHNNPAPELCLQLAKNRDPRRLWARSAHDADFLALRLGHGQLPFQISIKIHQPQNPVDPDPLDIQAHELAAAFRKVNEMPITLPLQDSVAAGLAGPRAKVLNTLRAVVVQLATHHSPRTVKIVAIYPETEAENWGWLRWLPHVWSDDRNVRYLACEPEGAKKLVSNLYERLSKRKTRLEKRQAGWSTRHETAFVFLLANPSLLEDEPLVPLLLEKNSALGAYAIFCADRVSSLPRLCTTIVNLEEDPSQLVRNHTSGELGIHFRPDEISNAFADRFSRILAPLRMQSDRGTEVPPMVPLLDLLGVNRVEELNVAERWQHNKPYKAMAVPVGRRAGGKIQYLDLHEQKGESTLSEGHGPHALVAGATGSGKSELLHALVAGLATSFHPHEVCFVLVDFKPPGMAALTALPHVINAIDANDLELLPRALQSLDHESKRRGKLFEAAGVDNLDDYMALHRRGAATASEPLPYIIIIVDEFTVLRQKLPQTMLDFEKVAITGRSHGFRMILVSQKPAGVVSEQVQANTRLRLCLRVERAEDSTELLDRPDAAGLFLPGQTYFRLGGEGKELYVRFQSAFSNAPYTPDKRVMSGADVLYRVMLDGSRQEVTPERLSEIAVQKQLPVLVSYIRDVAEKMGIERARPIWLEPLPATLCLSKSEVDGGWDGNRWAPVRRWLAPVIGLLDDPEHQRQGGLQPDIGRNGHLLIVSGNSASTRMAVRALIMSLARDHSPDELHFYLIDGGNSGLSIFKDLFHVASVIRTDEVRRLRRLFRWLRQQVNQRREWLNLRRVDSLASARSQGITRDMLPALVLVIDNLAALATELEQGPYGDIEARKELLAELASKGQDVGIHLVVIGDLAVHSTPFRNMLKNMRTLRMGLQLGEISNYRSIFDDMPADFGASIRLSSAPGRGLYYDDVWLECQIADLEIARDDEGERETIATQIDKMSAAARRLNQHQPYAIDDLPREVDLRQLINRDVRAQWAGADGHDELQFPIGLDDEALQPLLVNLERDGPHFLITGPPKGGKTVALRSWVLALSTSCPKEKVQFILIDTVKRSLEPLRHLPHVRCYVHSPEDYGLVVKNLREEFQIRRQSNIQQKRPAIVVVIDDYELVSTASFPVIGTGNNVFDQPASLQDELASCAQEYAVLGLHLLVAGKATAGNNAFIRQQIIPNCSGMIVGSHDLRGDLFVFNLDTMPHERVEKFFPGRGYFLHHGQRRLVQVATLAGNETVEDWVRKVQIADSKETEDM